jgi:hypothetical protein
MAGTHPGNGGGDIGPVPVGPGRGGVAAVEVDVDVDRTLGVVVDGPPRDPDGRSTVRRRLLGGVEVADDGVKAGSVVEGGGGVVACGRRAGAVDLPRGDAGDHAADDRSDAGDLLVALAVAEVRAAGLPIAAVAVGAPATGARAGAGADAVSAAPATVAGRVAVHVVAGPVAEARAVDLPPPAEQRARGTLVAAREGAAELGVAVAAGRTAVAVRAAAVAHRGVGLRGRERVGDRVGGDRRTHHGRAGEEAAPAEAGREHPGDLVDELR